MKRWYHTARWRHLQKSFLDENPLCVMCLEMGRDTSATVVDHKIPHKWNYDLFWDENNLQSLCKICHDSGKKIKDNGGVAPGCDVDGFPLDDDHIWNKKKN